MRHSLSRSLLPSDRQPRQIRLLVQKGFTLVEMMVALVLGLLLVAAGVQLFEGGLISVRLQQAGSELQDNGAFGLDYIAREVRMANYGNITNRQLTDMVPWGGVVLSVDSSTSVASNLPNVRTSATDSTAYIPVGLVTSGNGDTVSTTANQWQGLSNVTDAGGTAIKSDQLTLIYQAPAATTDCEGGAVTAGDYILERFYLRADSVTTPAASDTNMQNLVLACTAGKITAASVAAGNNCTTTGTVACPLLTGTAGAGSFGGAGQVLMSRVDQLHFLLGTQLQDGTNKFAYYTINQYKALAAPKPRILSIQVGVLVRSVANTSNTMIDTAKTYQLFDQTVKPNAVTNQNANRYARQVYITTIALRNALGDAS